MMKQIVFAGVAATLAMAGVAFAQSSTTALATPGHPTVLEVNKNGSVLIRGTVQSVASTSLTISSWGGTWTIQVPATAHVLPKSMSVGDFKQGDFVGVQGNIDQSSNWTVDATLVRDWTERQTLKQESHQNQADVREEIRAGTPRNVQGTLSNLSSSTFTLTSGNASYAVALTADAKVLTRNWLSLDLAKVQNGDTVRVWGPVSSSTITASVFRDISR